MEDGGRSTTECLRIRRRLVFEFDMAYERGLLQAPMPQSHFEAVVLLRKATAHYYSVRRETTATAAAGRPALSLLFPLPSALGLA